MPKKKNGRPKGPPTERLNAYILKDTGKTIRKHAPKFGSRGRVIDSALQNFKPSDA